MEETTLDPAWSRALAQFDASLHAHGMAEKTRRAYGVDLQAGMLVKAAFIAELP